MLVGDYSDVRAKSKIQKSIISNNIYAAILILSRLDIFMNMQGNLPALQTKIEDDVWIGIRCIFTPGRNIKKGTIIGMGSCVTKDFPEYSVIGGSPAKFIKSRKTEWNND